MPYRLLALTAAAALSACTLSPITDPGLPPFQANPTTPPEILGVAPDRMLETTQNWSDATRVQFWHVDQGSLMAPYDLALAIETAGDETLFFSPANIAQYRYVPQKAMVHNPDGLPLGFAKSKRQRDGETYLGMTCSACHSTVISYGGTGLLIDGAPSQGDFQGFYRDLGMAFRANLDDPAKFTRLAERIHGRTPSEAERATLEARMRRAIDAVVARETLNATDAVYGYGRVDAIGQIFNAVASANIDMPENRGDPNAPVNYPFLWGTHQSNVVQWNGFAPNVSKEGRENVRILGPLVRNAGEVLGVFGHIDVPAGRRGDPGVAYRNSTRLRNLMDIENWLEVLRPPPWPAAMFGEIDADKAARGREVYERTDLGNCAACHEVLPDVDACYNATMVPIEVVGTDPGQALNSLRVARTGPMEGRWARLPGQQGKLGPEEPILKMLVHQVIWGGVKDVEARPVTGFASLMRALRTERREDRCDLPFEANDNFKAYKARPLHGIWATAPFLHNGSVPSLRALLDAEADRPRTFTLGGWDFDPVNVGYAPYTGPRAFTYDTRLKGNSNRGHVYGTTLNAADKDALVEYLKSL